MLDRLARKQLTIMYRPIHELGKSRRQFLKTFRDTQQLKNLAYKNPEYGAFLCNLAYKIQE
jgi:hypothetical protein